MSKIDIFSQPHQPFFMAGVAFFMLFLSIFGFYFSGLLDIDKSIALIHVFPLVFIVFTQFFLGFLFVVFPKYLMRPSIDRSEYKNRAILFFISGLVYLFSLFVDNQVFIKLSILAVLASQVFSFNTLFFVYKKSFVKDKKDTKFILISFVFGILSILFIFISTFDFSYNYVIEKWGINTGFYLFLFGVIFTISQKMILLFTYNKVPGYTINKSKYLLDILFLLLFFKVVFQNFEYSLVDFIVN